MSEPASGPRRSARNAAKRVAEKVEEVVKAPAPKKTKAAPKSKANLTKSKPDVAESATLPEPKDASMAEGTVVEEPTKAPSADAATPAPEALKEGDELPSDLPAVTKHTGESVTIQDLVKESKNGIIIFAYPKGVSLQSRLDTQ